MIKYTIEEGNRVRILLSEDRSQVTLIVEDRAVVSLGPNGIYRSAYNQSMGFPVDADGRVIDWTPQPTDPGDPIRQALPANEMPGAVR